jgi:hypothetical protein
MAKYLPNTGLDWTALSLSSLVAESSKEGSLITCLLLLLVLFWAPAPVMCNVCMLSHCNKENILGSN